MHGADEGALAAADTSSNNATTTNGPIRTEVGIEDCLHIEFEYDRARYPLRGVVVGRVHFLLVRIRLKHMELEVRRRETCGSGSAAQALLGKTVAVIAGAMYSQYRTVKADQCLPLPPGSSGAPSMITDLPCRDRSRSSPGIDGDVSLTG